jgi:hypothetical protein
VLNESEISKLIEILKKPEIIRRKRLGLSSDQTFLKRFIKRNYNQTKLHKKMKNIVISDLILNGENQQNILIEKKPFKEYGFRPDITVFKDKKYVFFECHYHDGWCKGIPSHIYNNLDVVKFLGKIIICLKKQRKRNFENYIKNHKILSKVNEIWILDIKHNKIEKFINN